MTQDVREVIADYFASFMAGYRQEERKPPSRAELGAADDILGALSDAGYTVVPTDLVDAARQYLDAEGFVTGEGARLEACLDIVDGRDPLAVFTEKG